LDNIPYQYPCRKNGTAILKSLAMDRPGDEPVVDCDATQAADGCPWKQAVDKDRGTAILGMFGADCWYRGKYGEHLLALLHEHGHEPPGSFYGPQDGLRADGLVVLTASYCRELSAWMKDHAEVFASLLEGDQQSRKEELDRYRYAAWWLDWVAGAGHGAKAWW
jgi:hypothetical protein